MRLLDLRVARVVGAFVAMAGLVGCSGGSDGSIDRLDSRPIETVVVADRTSLEKMSAVWRSQEPDGHVVTLEGTINGQSASEYVVGERGSDIDWSISEMYERLDAALDGGAMVSATIDSETGVLASVSISGSSVDEVDLVAVEYRALNRPDGCATADGAITDLDAEPIEFMVFDDALRFTDSEACVVRRDVLRAFRGPEHCGWDEVFFIETADVIGEVISGRGRAFVHDPNDTLGTFDLIDRSRRFGVNELPTAVAATGFGIDQPGMRGELWASPDRDRDAVYLVNDEQAIEYRADPDFEIRCD